MDKLVRTYSCKRATRRWTVAFFMNMIDLAAYNALVLWITANPYWHQRKTHARRLFLRDLGTELISRHSSGRLEMPHGKRRRIQESARRCQLAVTPVMSTVDDNRSVGRCRLCSRKTDRKTWRRCDTCRTPTCKEHGRIVIKCADCG